MSDEIVEELGVLLNKAVYSDGSTKENAIKQLRAKADRGDALAQHFCYLALLEQDSPERDEYKQMYDKNPNKSKAQEELRSLADHEKNGTYLKQVYASEMMTEGKYDVAANYYEKALDSGIDDSETWTHNMMEQAKIAQENGHDNMRESIEKSSYYADAEELQYEPNWGIFNNMKQYPEAEDVTYTDRAAIKETIQNVTYGMESHYDEDDKKQAELMLLSLSAKGYPDAQKFMAEHFEKQGDYASAKVHFDRLARNEYISPLDQDFYKERSGQMADLNRGEEPRPITVFDKRDERIASLRAQYSETKPVETPKKSLSERLSEYGQRVKSAVATGAVGIINASAEFAKSGIQLTGAVLDSGVKFAGAFVNAPELGIGKGLESSLLKGIDKTAQWSSEAIKKMLGHKGGR